MLQGWRSYGPGRADLGGVAAYEHARRLASGVPSRGNIYPGHPCRPCAPRGDASEPPVSYVLTPFLMRGDAAVGRHSHVWVVTDRPRARGTRTMPTIHSCMCAQSPRVPVDRPTGGGAADCAQWDTPEPGVKTKSSRHRYHVDCHDRDMRVWKYAWLARRRAAGLKPISRRKRPMDAPPHAPEMHEVALSPQGPRLRLTRARLGELAPGDLFSRRPAWQVLEELTGRQAYDVVTGLSLRGVRALDPALTESPVWHVEILAPTSAPRGEADATTPE
jgi:hypothetical protein